MYEAPTWSWASKLFGVEFLFNSQVKKVYSEVVCIAEVHAAATTLEGKDPTGKISGGYIRLTGSIRKSNAGISKWDQKRWVSRQYEWYDEGYDRHGCRATGNTYHFLMAYKPYEPRSYHRQWEELKIGLILEMVEEASQTYKRVGMFSHPRHASFTSGGYDARRPLPEEYTEFASFDTENYERHTVTII